MSSHVQTNERLNPKHSPTGKGQKLILRGPWLVKRPAFKKVIFSLQCTIFLWPIALTALKPVTNLLVYVTGLALVQVKFILTRQEIV